jgi:hypothetical protein
MRRTTVGWVLFAAAILIAGCSSLDSGSEIECPECQFWSNTQGRCLLASYCKPKADGSCPPGWVPHAYDYVDTCVPQGANVQTVRGWQACRSENLRITGNEPLVPGGRVESVMLGDRDVCREVGSFNGTTYHVWGDGSGTVQAHGATSDDAREWRIHCSFDRIDDTHFCALSAGNISVRVTGSKPVVFVDVGHDHYPETEVAIRVDENEPWERREDGHWSGDTHFLIALQLVDGNEVMTAYAEWPSSAQKHRVMNL